MTKSREEIMIDEILESQNIKKPEAIRACISLSRFAFAVETRDKYEKVLINVANTIQNSKRFGFRIDDDDLERIKYSKKPSSFFFFKLIDLLNGNYENNSTSEDEIKTKIELLSGAEKANLKSVKIRSLEDFSSDEECNIFDLNDEANQIKKMELINTINNNYFSPDQKVYLIGVIIYLDDAKYISLDKTERMIIDELNINQNRLKDYTINQTIIQKLRIYLETLEVNESENLDIILFLHKNCTN